MKSILNVIVLTFLLLMLNGCQVSEEDAILLAKDAFYESFLLEDLEPNFEGHQVNFHLPRGIEITDESEYNIQLEKGNQIFLLFFIPVEPWTSNVHLVRDQEVEEDAVIFEIEERNGKLGYLAIHSQENDLYKLIVGLGGAKITTITEAKDLEESTILMTNILQTMEYN